MADIKFSQFTSGGNVRVGDIVVGLRASDNVKFTFPGTGISDADGNFLLGYSSVGSSAVNYISFENADTTLGPTISSKGSDSNIDLNISSKMMGNVNINGVLFDSSKNISQIATAVFASSVTGQTTLKGQASVGTLVVELPDASGTLALTSGIPSFPLSLGMGGTGASLSASNGGIFYSNATTGAILPGTATAGQILRSGASSAPSWSTTTYPSTTTINGLLYAVAGNTVGQTAVVNGAVLVSSSAGVPVWSSSLTNGQVVIGSTGGQPQAASIMAGSGITLTAGSNSLMISSTTGGGGLIWNSVAGTTALADINNGYIISNAGATTITLPSVAPVSSMISVQGQGAAGWIIQSAVSQIIHVGGSPSTAGGTVGSTNRYDAITLVCIVADSEWGMYGPVSSAFVIT